MKISSSGIINGIIQDEYGKYGSRFERDMPVYSLPLHIEGAPKNTVSFAIIMDDQDAIPVVGYVWIHWLVANLTKTEIPAGDSMHADNGYIQGENSWHIPVYGGPMPPDRPHTYDIKVYALDKMLDLKKGFSVDELYQAMQGHVLETAELKGSYRN